MSELQLHYQRNIKGCLVTEMEWFSTSPPYAVRDRVRLEKRLKSLHRRHIEAVLLNANREEIGGVEADDGVNDWNWWYDSAVFEAPVADLLKSSTTCVAEPIA